VANPYGRARTLAIWGAWHLLCAAFIPLVLVELRLQVGWWEMSQHTRLFLAGVAATYLLFAAAVSWLARRRNGIGFAAVAVLAVVAFGTLFVVLRVTSLAYSQSVLVMAGGAAIVLGSIGLELVPRLYLVLLPAMLVATVALANVAVRGWPADSGERVTAFFRVRLVQAAVIRSEVLGGGVEPLAGGILIAAGDSSLYYLAAAAGPARQLPYTIPSNRAEFRAAAPASPPGTDLRVSDILVQEEGERLRLYASHHFWHADRNCLVLRISVANAATSAFVQGTASVGWQTVYESQPCLPLSEIRVQQNGGRMLALDERTLLLTVGDHGFDGYYAKASLPQDPGAHYGKTLRIDLATGRADVYTTGHRNPQGLIRTDDGRVWLAEQGPAGGDELNLLVAGENYGWPLVTYGVAYDEHTWPLNAVQARHGGYVEPAFAWVPSIAVTSVAAVRRDQFPVWRGDLLVGSLTGRILRLQTSGDRVSVAELLYETRGRIRDLIEAPDGRVFMLFDDNTVRYLEAVEEEDADTRATAHPGQQLYRMCQDCHAIGSGLDHRSGPDLRGVLGRAIASADRFEYSPALAAQSGTWSEARLHRFLENPQADTPGTSMQTAGISDPEVRRLLIEYLASKQ
jgi:cytochrome c2